MATRRVKFTFPTQLITEPIIYELGHRFKIVTNIRRADVREDMGWVALELEGSEEEIVNGLEWVADAGVRVDPGERRRNRGLINQSHPITAFCRQQPIVAHNYNWIIWRS